MNSDVIIQWDPEAKVWVAINDSIPMALESDSLEKLKERVLTTAPEIIMANGLPIPETIVFKVQPFEGCLFSHDTSH